MNNAMGIKAPGVWFRQSEDEGDREIASNAPEVLDKYHGQATGLFSGDECFAGLMPSQGTETCAVVEYLFSLETLLSILGNPQLGDRLEKIAFNALPAPFKPDMRGRQYVQQANQPVARVSEDRIYTTNGEDANLYGLETNYGCCTANMHQGWPKFAAHLWMKNPGSGLVAVAYAPSSVLSEIGGARVRIDLETEYPFSEILTFRISTDRAVRFPLKLRIPAWTSNATAVIGTDEPITATAGEFLLIDREWADSTELVVRFPMTVDVERRFNGAATVSRGPLVYSLQIKEDWRRLRGENPYADWEVLPASPWNYALEMDVQDPGKTAVFESRPLSGNPFRSENAPVAIRVRGRRLPDWKLKDNAAAPPPVSPVGSTEALEELLLIPYGAAKLRITEFPILR